MSTRKSHRLVAAIGIVLDIEGKKHPCMTGNVGPRGLYAMLENPVAAGKHIGVVVIEGQHRLATRARVASNDGRGLGLSFVDPDGVFQVGWRRLLNSLRKRTSVEGLENDPSRAFAWSFLPDGSILHLLKKRVRRDRVSDFSPEGAAFVSRKRPEVGTELLIYVFSAEEGEQHCRAEVTRHTGHGFAVRFLEPRSQFRHAVARLRRAIELE